MQRQPDFHNGTLRHMGAGQSVVSATAARWASQTANCLSKYGKLPKWRLPRDEVRPPLNSSIAFGQKAAHE